MRRITWNGITYQIFASTNYHPFESTGIISRSGFNLIWNPINSMFQIRVPLICQRGGDGPWIKIENVAEPLFSPTRIKRGVEKCAAWSLLKYIVCQFVYQSLVNTEHDEVEDDGNASCDRLYNIRDLFLSLNITDCRDERRPKSSDEDGTKEPLVQGNTNT